MVFGGDKNDTPLVLFNSFPNIGFDTVSASSKTKNANKLHSSHFYSMYRSFRNYAKVENKKIVEKVEDKIVDEVQFSFPS